MSYVFKDIFNVEITLCRYIGEDGKLYSAIYQDGKQIVTTERDSEPEMISEYVKSKCKYERIG